MKGSSKPLNIKIITTEAFPIGLAATNRIMTYAKGFAENNCQITVWIIKPTERAYKIFNQTNSGSINGVKYNYIGGQTLLAKKFIKRRIDNFRGILKSALNILSEKKDNKTDAIIYYSTSTSRALIFYIITRFKNILFLKEESEFPSIYLKNMNSLQKALFKNLHYSLFDGSLLMTNKLIEYFVNEKKNKTPYLHVPMTVDFERFFKIQKNNLSPDYIAYCGVLNNEKDGVNILIEAFALITDEFPGIKLYLIGDAGTQLEMDQYQKQVDNNNLLGKVVFKGRLGKDEIPEILVSAKILVLPRPPSFQSEGGFPTKLGEYLATGNPVIVTKVGEIANYLTDLENVYMAEPGSVDSLVKEFKAVLYNYPGALKIGEKGREIVMKHFNYKVQTNNIINFIRSLNETGI